MKSIKNLFLKIILSSIILYSIIGFVVLPYFVQFYIPTTIKKTIQSDSYVDSIHFNPFTFTVSISNFMIKDQANKNMLFFGKLKLNLDPFYLLKNELKISNIELDNFKLSIDIDKNKEINFQYILDIFEKNNKNNKIEKPKTQKSNESFLVKVDKLDFSNIHFSFEDHSKQTPFILNTKPINLNTTDIQLTKDHTNRFDFSIDTHNTGKINLEADVVFEPISVDGKVKFSNIAVNKIFDYIKPSNLEFDIDSTTLDLALDYHYKQEENKKNINLKNIETSINKFQYKQKPYLVELNNFHHKTKTLDLTIDTNTAYNIQNLSTNIETLIVKDSNKKDSLSFSDFYNHTSKINDNKNEVIETSQTLKTPSSGIIKANIKATQEPLKVDIELETKDIAIKPFQEYISDFANLNINSGFISNSAKINFSNQDKKSNISLDTDLTLNKIDITNSSNQQQLIKLNKVDLSKLQYKNDELFIKKITIEKPYIYFALNKNNTTNFSNIVPKKQNIDKSEDNKKPFNYNIEKISILDGSSLFEDKTVTPTFRSVDDKISGDLNFLSSDKTKATTITHASIIDKYAPLLINTKLIISDPFETLKSDLKVENIDLPSLSSYSGKFIGQKISNGKLSLTLDYDIKKGQLQSTNNIKIKDIQLGEKVQSKDAIDAPIGLAIALLEDSDGYIDLDIPIVGDIKSPSFHLSDVILDVITNTIVGIVSAPFKFLAMMIGLDGDDLSTIAFDYGDSNITVTQKENLDNIIKAFQKRPNLKLKITSSYDQVEDTKAIQKTELQKSHPAIFSKKVNFEELYKNTKKIFIEQFGTKEYNKLKQEQQQKYNTMISKLENTIVVSQNSLLLLATQRANKIKDYLLEKGLQKDRIKIEQNLNKNNKDLKSAKVIVVFDIETK